MNSVEVQGHMSKFKVKGRICGHLQCQELLECPIFGVPCDSSQHKEEILSPQKNQKTFPFFFKTSSALISQHVFTENSPMGFCRINESQKICKMCLLQNMSGYVKRICDVDLIFASDRRRYGIRSLPFHHKCHFLLLLGSWMLNVG